MSIVDQWLMITANMIGGKPEPTTPVSGSENTGKRVVRKFGEFTCAALEVTALAGTGLGLYVAATPVFKVAFGVAAVRAGIRSWRALRKALGLA